LLGSIVRSYLGVAIV